MADFRTWVDKNKELWTRVFDEVIAPTFEDEWKKRSETHGKELNQKSEDQKSLLNHINGLLVIKSRLTEENEALKQRLDEMAPTSTAQKPTTLHTPEGDMTNLSAKYHDLSRKYQDLSQKMKYLERKNQTVMQKNRDMKASVKAWQEYADRQAGRHKSRNDNKPPADRLRPSVAPDPQTDRSLDGSSPISTDSSRNLAPLSADSHSSSPLSAPLAISEHTAVSPPTLERDRRLSGSATPKPTEKCGLKESLSMNVSPLHIQESGTMQETSTRQKSSIQPVHPSSSQTTVDERTDPQNKRSLEHVISNEDEDEDDDIPQFVSERSLKRKREQNLNARVHRDYSSDGTPIKPIRIKEERSSPPLVEMLSRKETIDLDEVSNSALRTPRHPRSRFYNAGQDSMAYQQSTSASFSHAFAKPIGLPPRLSRTFSSAIDAEEPGISNIDVRAFSEPTEPARHITSVLQPIDPNTVSALVDEPPLKRARHGVQNEGNAYKLLDESGEELLPVDENAKRFTPSMARAKRNQMLKHENDQKNPGTYARDINKTPTKQIKTEPSLPSSSLIHTSGDTTKKGKQKSRQHESRSATRDSPGTNNRPVWTLSTPMTRSMARTSPSTNPTRSSSRAQTRLRSKAVSELSIQDFKPNPVYNNGYSYAFSETVRKRGDRMCLPGCTNPQCCGSTFRTLAAAQAPLTLSQEESLLEDYLGDAYDNMCLTQMAVDERAELVLQARTRKLAKASGKHRQAYEGRRTPPGFWRVDFPTTQEQEEDRERAKEQERKQVHERWLEAQRRDGRWIFRDE